jgi:hypothetical protein
VSVVPLGISIAEAVVLNLIGGLFVRVRNIAGFVPSATVREHHVDELAITEHPVEQGAAITDHSYKRPARVTLEIAWSNSDVAALGDPNYVQSIYAQLLALQASRQTFTIVTGKRVYDSMLAERFSVTTDEKTENALFVTAECRQIIIAQTSIASVGSPANMSNPSMNAPTTDQGANAVQPAPPTYNADAAKAALANS